MNFFEILFLFFSFLSVILGILFFIKKKGDRLANVIFGIYLLLFSYNILYNFLYWTKELYIGDTVHLVRTNRIVWLLYGPMLFFYVKRIINKRFQLYELVHFIPAIVLLLNFSVFYSLSRQEKIQALLDDTISNYLFISFPGSIGIIILSQFFYFGFIFFKLKKELTSINQKTWVSWLSISYFGYCVSFACYFMFLELGWMQIGYDYFIGISMIFFVGLVTYFGFLQPDVFNGLSMKKVTQSKKYIKTGLTESHSQELRDTLINHMDQNKPYLNCELKLESLANDLNLSRHHMSQVINEQFDSNFFDFINKYRVDEAKLLLINETNLNITDVLYKSGFSNRVSFNKSFKRHTGMTPSQYKSIQAKSS